MPDESAIYCIPVVRVVRGYINVYNKTQFGALELAHGFTKTDMDERALASVFEPWRIDEDATIKKLKPEDMPKIKENQGVYKEGVGWL